MRGNSLLRLAAVCAAMSVLWGSGVSRAAGDEDSASSEIDKAKTEFSGLWNVDQLMFRAAENISKRYNLNETQRKQTHEMLTREVNKFLNEHEDIWPLVRDLTRFQQAGEQPQGKIGEKLGAKVLPLLREIEDTIVEANERWRDILTEDQKRMHDFDLEDMAKTFAKMNDQFRTMAQGEPSDARLFPEPNRDAKPPKIPERPEESYKPLRPIPVVRELPREDMWERYVREFRRDYRLDDAQSEAALSILKECMNRAADYRKSKRKEFARVEERLRDANRTDLTPKARTAKTRVWVQIERALNKPIVDLFQELKTRLEPIPTDAQRAYAKRAGRVATTKAKRKSPKKQKEPPAVPPDDAAAKPAVPETSDTTAPTDKAGADEKPNDASKKKTAKRPETPSAEQPPEDAPPE